MSGPAPTIIAGTRYGNLITTGVYIKSYKYGNKWINAKLECLCDCGNIVIKRSGHLRVGNVKTCGNKCPLSSCYTHRLSKDKNSKVTKEYNAWGHMIDRCDNPNHPQYPTMVGKGITYHESLSTFEGFWEIMGKAPSKYHRFTRIDKSGDFEPGNVHWYLAKKFNFDLCAFITKTRTL